MKSFLASVFLSALFFTGCSADDMSGQSATSGDVPVSFSHFAQGVDAYLDGDVVVIHSTGVPNHGSPYF